MITVSRLSKSILKAKELENIIKEHLFIIDDKILKSNRTWGKNVITHELPITFNILGNDNKMDLQRLVYSAILKNLEKRGFTTKILLDSNKTVLYIIWICEYTPEELSSMDEIIKKNRISPDAVEAFIKN